MKVLSLFDGMACGMLAFQKADIEVERYVAYEIDKYAIKVATHNFPMIEQRGDVFEADFTEFEGFDFVVGGSPCTYWSIAQTKNRETEAHGIGWELFQQYVRAIREAKPKYFIYENNKSMSDAIRREISEAFGFEPIMINSALVSAQNRQRLYWVGVRNADGTYHKADIDQPDDRGILLKDVLDDGVTWKEKSHCIDANYYKGGNLSSMEKQSGKRLMVAEPINTFNNNGEKSRTLMAGYYKYGMATMVTNDGFKGGATGVAEPVAIAYRTRDNDDGSKSKRYEANGSKSNCITTVPSDSMVAEPVPKGATVLNVNPSGRGMNGAVMHVNGKSRCLTTNKGEGQKIIQPVSSEPIRVGSLPRPNGELSTSQAMRIYSDEGKGVGLKACGGGMGGKTGLYAVPICHTIPQPVTVRKYTCDIEKLKALLRDHKNMTNKEIAQTLGKPQTLVEHWFRKDECFAVPDPDIWFDLKKLLGIETTEFDDFVTVFETRDGVFEKADRCYDPEGKMSTLMTCANDNVIVPCEGSVGNMYGKGQNGQLFGLTSKTKTLSAGTGQSGNGIGSNNSPKAILPYPDYDGEPIYEVKDGMISIKGKQYPIKLADGYYIIRKLTVSECKRLQTVPEDYDMSVISNTQAYKCLGNGWTIDVIVHLIKGALEDVA